MKKESLSAIWEPQVGPQLDAIENTWVDEMMFGGARGGGKSDFLLGDYLQDVIQWGRHWQGILFRRTYPELQQLIQRSRSIYPRTGATWREKDRDWTWPNGARLRMRYLEYTRDATRYQGHSYGWIGFDELTQWVADTAYNELKACLRWAEADLPNKRIRSTANPGGVGHTWVKKWFVDPAPMGGVAVDNEVTGMTRMFIRSKVQDNKILLANDPDYIKRLHSVGSPELVRAWLEGDWDAIQGAFFPEFEISSHVTAPRKLPSYWARFRSIDWGSYKPFAVGWFAVSDGTEPDPKDSDGSISSQYPAGSIVQYREYYGTARDENGSFKPNKGIKLPPSQVATDIIKHTGQERIAYTICDPSMFKTQGGPSVAEQMRTVGLSLKPADNNRINGWNEFRARLRGEDSRPMFYIMSNCLHAIRTLPSLQHDATNPEDADTEGEDHSPDMQRYALMSRPKARRLDSDTDIKPRFMEDMTLDELWEQRAEELTLGKTNYGY